MFSDLEKPLTAGFTWKQAQVQTVNLMPDTSDEGGAAAATPSQFHRVAASPRSS